MCENLKPTRWKMRKKSRGENRAQSAGSCVDFGIRGLEVGGVDKRHRVQDSI